MNDFRDIDRNRMGGAKILRVEPEFDAQATDRAAYKFISSPSFKIFTNGWGLYDRPHFGHEYRSQMVEWLGPEYTGQNQLAIDFINKYRRSISQISNMLYDGMRVVGDRLTTNKCGFCASPVSDQHMETTFAKMANLGALSKDAHPDLVWDNKFVLKCSSCGAPGTDIDLTPVVKRWSGEMGRADERSYYWPFQRKNMVGAGGLTLSEFINNALLGPFREGFNVSVIKVRDQLENDK
jgi:hypothetical protein